MAIVFTSQQSRFKLETLETPSKDIDVNTVNLSVGDTQLLEDAQLRLFSGVHYGLVGKNGVGKSTLLRALGFIRLYDLPSHLRVLYVDQLEDVDDTQSVLSLVVNADRQAVQYRRQAELVEAATRDGGAEACARAVQQVELERLETELEDAQQTATKRSGARGFDARHRLIETENRVKAAEEALQAEVGPDMLSTAPEAAQQLLDVLFQRLALADPGLAEAEARRILLGLGFTTAQQDGPISKLSGGWRMRVALAQALFIKPDLLLFDEPTNHLDLPAILWLTKYLRELEDVTLVVVSHDRTFLNAVAQEIIIMRDKNLTYYSGNYDEYVTNTEEKALHMSRLKEAVDKKRAHIEKSIEEGKRAAKKSGDDKKLGMVASRKKKLERLGMEKNEKGHRFSVQKDMIGYYTSTRAEIKVEAPDPVPHWKLPEPGPLRQGGALLELEAVSFGYPTRPGFLRPVLNNVTLNVELGARLGVVGANGAGKSTLMKLMVGELQPTSGTVKQLPQARLGVFLQHHVEDLVSKGAEGGTPLSHMAGLYPGRKEQELRGHLGTFHIKGALATQPLSTLSGGQAVRVALAATTYAAPHLLILDEPSNHLDLGGVEALLAALKAYSGAVVLVSHDQHLVSSFAEIVYHVGDKKVRRLEGGMAQYVKELKVESRKAGTR